MTTETADILQHVVAARRAIQDAQVRLAAARAARTLDPADAAAMREAARFGRALSIAVHALEDADLRLADALALVPPAD